MSKRNRKEHTWGHLRLKIEFLIHGALMLFWTIMFIVKLKKNPASFGALISASSPKIQYLSGCSFVVSHLKKGGRRTDFFYVIKVFHLGQRSLQIQLGSANVDLH